MVVAVAAALDALEIVALRSLNVAEAGAAAHDIEDDAGQLRAGAVGYAFLLEADAGAGRRGNGAGAGAGCAIDHVYCRDLAFGLEEAASDLGHTCGHVLRYLCLRGDRIAEEETGACANSGFRDCFATLHKSQCHFLFLLIPSLS